MKTYYNDDEESKIDLINEPAVSYGSPSTNTQYFLINQIQHGISYSSFHDLQKQSPFNIAEWSSYLHLTDRTLLRYKTENKIFENIHAEKILELTKLIKKGIDTFNSKENFSQWLNTVSVSLGGYKPKDLLVTSIGINIVYNELIRIDYGVLA